MRRTEALDATTFLVDQDRRAEITSRFTQFLNQRSNLRGVIDIALEKDKAPGTLGAQKGALVSGQGKAGYAGDEGSGAHGAD